MRDPDAIVRRFGEEFEKLVLIALMEDWDEAFDALGAAATLKRHLQPATPRRKADAVGLSGSFRHAP